MTYNRSIDTRPIDQIRNAPLTELAGRAFEREGLRAAPPLMSLGSALLKLRQWSGHGLTTAYYRDVVRPRILRTPPVRGTSDRRCELHVLTCRSDWLNLLWSLKSFYRFSQREYSLCIHEDGTVPPEGLRELNHHFPHARLVLRSEADLRMERELGDFPRSLSFRRTNPLAPKVFDFAAYLESDRMLLFDSDLLFFDEPRELLRRIEDPSYLLNSVNRDVATAYTVEPWSAGKSIGSPVAERFNSGLGLIHRSSLRFEWMEEFLQIPGLQSGHFWRVEQTLYALCSSRHGVELLPEEYAVRLDGPIGSHPVRHYVGAIRHLMYREGIARLAKDGFVRC
jgi:hypothetical protein